MGGSNDEYFLCASDAGDYVEAVLSVNSTQIHLYEQVRVDKTKPAWSTGQPSGVQVVLGFRRRLRADAHGGSPYSPKSRSYSETGDEGAELCASSACVVSGVGDDVREDDRASACFSCEKINGGARSFGRFGICFRMCCDSMRPTVS